MSLLEDSRINFDDAICDLGYRVIDIICLERQVEMLKVILNDPQTYLNALLPGSNFLLCGLRIIGSNISQ
jgi:hypothetical protein